MVGRNEPCPCGSGKKYKHCCLRADEARARTTHGRDDRTEVSTEAAEAQMLQQTGFSTAAELQEAMDDYRRFCESLPDDADVPSFMEYLQRPSPASDVVRQMRSEAGDRSFGSTEELQQFLDERTSSMNDAPRDDFEGLSSAQMHEILHAREAERVPLLRFSGSLAAADAETAPLVATIRWVIQYHADHGGTIRLTARQNYPRALCRAYLAHFVPWYRDGMTVPNEESLFILVLAHDLLVAFGWTTETKKLSEITTEGVQMLSSGGSSGGGARSSGGGGNGSGGGAGASSGGAGEVFRRAFQYLLLSTDWAESLGEEYEGAAGHLALIQNAAIFSLYLLSRHPEGTVRELFERFTRAFPDFVKPAQGDQRTIDWLGTLFADLFIEEFCVPLGLVAVTGGEGGPGRSGESERGQAGGAAGRSMATAEGGQSGDSRATAQSGRGTSRARDELDRRYRTTKLFRSAVGWG